LGSVRIIFIGYTSFVLDLQGVFNLGARIIAGVIAGIVGFTAIVNYTKALAVFASFQRSSETLRADFSQSSRKQPKLLSFPILRL
jgi:hypothetical protein